MLSNLVNSTLQIILNFNLIYIKNVTINIVNDIHYKIIEFFFDSNIIYLTMNCILIHTYIFVRFVILYINIIIIVIDSTLLTLLFNFSYRNYSLC